MNRGVLLERLFSRATIIVLFLVVSLLLAASFYTYLQDQKLQEVSIGELRIASWALSQLGSEASALDREIALFASGVGDREELLLRYDILWSRYNYLLNGTESSSTRNHSDNEPRLEGLFGSLKAMEQPLMARLEDTGDGWADLVADWDQQQASIRQLVADNFVGSEASRLVSDVEDSRDRLANLRVLTLAALAILFTYLALAIIFLRKKARTDPVTGLPNANFLASMQGVSPDKMILACEIREFQLVLSDFGNEGASELVKIFVSKLEKQLRPADQLIQISQSEFLLIVSPARKETTEQTVKRLAEVISFDWSIENSVIHISAVLGVTPPCEEDCKDWNTRYQLAYRALAQAHLEGSRYHINREDLRERIEEDREIHAGLINFFNNEPGNLRLHLVYQPIVRAENRHFVTGAEVLLRCSGKNIGFVPPNRIVDLCERFGLGVDLGRWLFRQIAAETRQLYSNMGFSGNISINLNPAMLTEDLAKDVQVLLIDGGIPATNLCMEITEDNAALDFYHINRLIRHLHDLGVSFALDDFGTGHSSLEYVRELQVDRLKIDRCFVDGIELSEDKARFLGSIIAMSDQAYMQCVIEGVENEEQWQLILNMGDVLIQGYHAHRPVPLNDYIGLLLDPVTAYPGSTVIQ